MVELPQRQASGGPLPPPRWLVRESEAFHLLSHPLRAQDLDTAKVLERAKLSERIGVAPLAVNRLPSGDLAIQVASAAAAQRIREADVGWIEEVFGAYSKELPQVADPLHTQRHSLVLHRVATDHDLPSIRAELERSSGGIINELDWLVGPKRRQLLVHSSIRVKLASAEICAKLLNEGAVGIHNAVCMVAPYQPQERIVKCTSCQRYNHTARHCKAPTSRCRICKGEHHTSKHPSCSSCGCNDGTCKHARQTSSKHKQLQRKGFRPSIHRRQQAQQQAHHDGSRS